MECKLKKDCYVTSKYIRSKLSKQFPNSSIFISDERMYLVYQSDISMVLAKINIVKNMLNLVTPFSRIYTKDNFDCEDYTKRWSGIASQLYPKFCLGIVLVKTSTGAHALNCFLDEFGKFHYIEPQINGWFDDEAEMYEPYMVWM